MFYAIYMATHSRACACIFHKTLGLMLYLLHTTTILSAIDILRRGGKLSILKQGGELYIHVLLNIAHGHLGRFWGHASIPRKFSVFMLSEILHGAVDQAMYYCAMYGRAPPYLLGCLGSHLVHSQAMLNNNNFITCNLNWQIPRGEYSRQCAII